MAVGRRTSGPSLGEFLTALGGRLAGLSREELVAVLVTHAERLPARDREAFLDIFPDPGLLPGAGRPAASVSPGAVLLADVDEFAARVAAGEYAEDDEYYPDGYGWADDEEAAPWVADADDLFAAIGEVFVAGNLDTAREAYERLLALFGPAGDDAWSLESWRLESTDVTETLARYLRSVYETTPPKDRAGAVHRAWLDLPWSPTAPSLQDMVGARREPLADLDAFVPGWIECLLADAGRPPLRQRVALLTEAAVLHAGVDGLADLARRPGAHQGDVYLNWIDALTAAGRLGDASDAAREALHRPDGDARHLAEAADRLADLSSRSGDSDAAIQARIRAWRAAPTRRRLLALTGSALSAGVLPETLATEADALVDALADAGHTVTDRLGCELLLLAGRLDQASAALAGAESLGWHRPGHPGPVVLPVLWAAATGTAPAAHAGHLGRAFAAIDDDPDTVPRLDDLDSPDDHPAASLDDPAPDAPTLTGLLADVIRHHRDVAADRDRWLTTAAGVVDARIEAIVSGKHRGAYARAASLAFAHAETLAAVGRADDARTYLAGVRVRYPRHVAFRRELDTATRTSTLDPPGPARTRR